MLAEATYVWPFSPRKDAAVKKVQKAHSAFCSGHFTTGDCCSPVCRGLLPHAAACDPCSKGNKHTPFQLGLCSLDGFYKYLKEHFQNCQRNLIIYLHVILWELTRGLQTQAHRCKRLFVRSVCYSLADREDNAGTCHRSWSCSLPGESKHMKADQRSYVLTAILYVLVGASGFYF